MKSLNYLQSFRSLLRVRKNYCIGYQKVHEKYGDTVFMSFPLNLMVTRDNKLIEEILRDDLNNYGRSNLLLKSYGHVVKDGILAQEGKPWKKSRKGILSSLNFKNLDGKREVLRTHIEKLIPKKEHKKLNFTELSKNYAFKNMNKLIFEDAFDEQIDDFKLKVDHALTYLSKQQKDPLFYSRRNFKKALKNLDAIRDIISSKIDQGKLNKFNQAHDEFSKKAIIAQAMNVLAAGYETTASTGIWCMYFMIKHNISSDDINKAINETLRLFPAVGVLLRRNNGEKKIQGRVIPDGSEIVCNLYSLHRSCEYWDNPKEFRLDRNLENSKYFKPFGYGPTICPGKALSLLELEVMFQYILDNFNISFSENNMDGFIYHRTDASIKPAFDLLVDLVPK